MAERTLSRWMFVACCLLPTLAVCGWTAAVCSPPYRRAKCRSLERQFAQETGLGLQLETLRRRRDGTIQLGRVAVLGPAGTQLVTADDMTLQTDGGSWRLQASRIALQRDDVWRLWQSLDHRLLRSAHVGQRHVRLDADNAEVTCGADTTAEQLKRLELVVQVADELRSCELRFATESLPGGKLPPPTELVVAQKLSADLTHVKLTAGRVHGVSARLLSRDLQLLAGERCRFYGQAHAVRRGEAWTTQVVDAELKPVDLRLWSGEAAPLTGELELQIRQMQLTNGRLELAEGRLVGQGGTLDASTLEAMAEYLEVEPVDGERPDRSASAHPIPYRRLETRFWLDPYGLALKGECNVGQDVMIVDTEGAPLLRSRAFYARHSRVLLGLSRTAADTPALERRAPSPVTRTAASTGAAVR